jgi:hypothetical protein
MKRDNEDLYLIPGKNNWFFGNSIQ